jgi:hypothetical protein
VDGTRVKTGWNNRRRFFVKPFKKMVSKGEVGNFTPPFSDQFQIALPIRGGYGVVTAWLWMEDGGC